MTYHKILVIGDGRYWSFDDLNEARIFYSQDVPELCLVVVMQ